MCHSIQTIDPAVVGREVEVKGGRDPVALPSEDVDARKHFSIISCLDTAVMLKSQETNPLRYSVVSMKPFFLSFRIVAIAGAFPD
jgi:hypothetical protein